MSNPERHAFSRGRAAARVGRRRDSNPYHGREPDQRPGREPWSVLARAWFDGFDRTAAQQQIERG